MESDADEYWRSYELRITNYEKEIEYLLATCPFRNS